MSEAFSQVLTVVVWAVLALFWVYIAARLAVRAGARSWWESWKRWSNKEDGE